MPVGNLLARQSSSSTDPSPATRFDVSVILPSPRPVLCIGAIHSDTLAHAAETYRPETSTPARLTHKPGGVATNIARSLNRLATPTALLGAIGRDDAGDALTKRLAQEGLQVLTCKRPGFVTGQYIAFHNPDGSLAAASVDDRVLSTAPADLFDTLWEAVDPAFINGLWFIDANLPAGLLEAVVCSAPKDGLIANAVSNAKAARLKPVLPKLSCLMLNRGEALSLTGAAPDTSNEDLISRLQKLGAQRIVLTNGKADVLAFEGGRITSHPTLATKIVDVTGAGDALTAGIIASLSRGIALVDAVPFGLKAAALTLQSPGALSENMSWTALSQSSGAEA
ncbi:PfkB family carbohydrate kinase [Roseibium sp.]|uniref:PfkB family carbohydrate kinase n=1 Tax=Roseibium sp. TaxID=1936156 RepID=UPI003B52ABE7